MSSFSRDKPHINWAQSVSICALINNQSTIWQDDFMNQWIVRNDRLDYYETKWIKLRFPKCWIQLYTRGNINSFETKASSGMHFSNHICIYNWPLKSSYVATRALTVAGPSQLSNFDQSFNGKRNFNLYNLQWPSILFYVMILMKLFWHKIWCLTFTCAEIWEIGIRLRSLATDWDRDSFGNHFN